MNAEPPMSAEPTMPDAPDAAAMAPTGDAALPMERTAPVSWRWRAIRRLLAAVAVVIGAGCLVPAPGRVPVEGATPRDWNPRSFWFEPWGASGVHKGIDIFAPQGRPVVSAVPGIVIFQDHLPLGGNVVGVLGPQWRVHYHAHLADGAAPPRFVAAGTRIGAVGSTGNAAGKPPHLHYAVVSVFPLPWRYRPVTQGWKRMFFIDPAEVIDRR
jgi:murein DD-endopeptidase MepM/ murein hydrolase activator NlpD